MEIPKTPANEQQSIILEEKLLEKISIPEPENCPKIITIIGPCRTGSGTIFTTIANGAQIIHPQGQKAVARQAMIDIGLEPSTKLEFFKDTIEIQPGNHTELFKETFGVSFNPADFINPISIWLKKGVPPQNLTVVATTRDPLDVAASQQRMWKFDNDFPLDEFNQSFTWTLDICNWAKSLGIQILPINFDLGINFSANQIFSRVFRQLNLPFQKDQTTTWQNDRYLAGVNYDKPPLEFIQGQLSQASGGRGGFVWKHLNINRIFTRKQKRHILKNIKPAQQVHQTLKQESGQILKLKRDILDGWLPIY